ncbi:MAG: competence type IV pilus major pilin ComGC [Atopococcus tabaci]|uniref:Competence type IV pilus major pilin ComGC n=1 Tax=Atopococcus tabaci TaxID=269774 RepID=A0AA43RNN0_9LACT|nr:competence type IV pilus major pilin ComGC [Atopococcus tabaci]
MKILHRFEEDETGFTLLEMLIVLFVLGLLLLVIIPNVTKHQDSAETKGDAAFAATVQTQVDLYKMDTGSTPTTFGELASGEDPYLNQDQLSEATENLALSNGKVTLTVRP